MEGEKEMENAENLEREKLNWETIWKKRHKKNVLYIKKAGERLAIGIGSNDGAKYFILEQEEVAYLILLLETMLKKIMIRR